MITRKKLLGGLNSRMKGLTVVTEKEIGGKTG